MHSSSPPFVLHALPMKIHYANANIFNQKEIVKDLRRLLSSNCFDVGEKVRRSYLLLSVQFNDQHVAQIPPLPVPTTLDFAEETSDANPSNGKPTNYGLLNEMVTWSMFESYTHDFRHSEIFHLNAKVKKEI
jgi:hypothetical protein